MRRALACIVPAVVLAAADPDPASFIPADAVLSARAPQLQRSQQRWAATPYPRLLATVWGRTLTGEWGGRLERLAPGASATLTGLGAAAIGVALPQGSRPQTTLAVRGVGEALQASASALLRGPAIGQPTTFHGDGGRATLHGGVLAWSSGEGGPVLAGAAPAPPADAEADLLVNLDLDRWSSAMGLPRPAGAAAGPLQVALRLDPLGLRERIIVAPGDSLRTAAVQAKRWADPAELSALPGTTLWAATWQADPQVTALLLPPAGDAGMQQMERWMADAGLPGWRDTLLALDGPATVWMAEGLPFPSLTCAWSMPREHAARWIAAAVAKLGLVDAGDGSAAGFVGLLPLAVGWIADGANGRLVATTDPAGLEAWKGRKPGFAAHAGVAEVLSGMPARTIVLGAGRGGASWGALAQLAVPVFTAMGSPQSVSLPGDLRAASDRGWLYGRLLADGTLQVESAGLAGGPFAASTMAGIAVPATVWLQGEQRRQRVRREAAQPETPAAPAAPVF